MPAVRVLSRAVVTAALLGALVAPAVPKTPASGGHAAAVIRVAPDGTDVEASSSPPGKPLATLGRALEFVARLRSDEPGRPITVDLGPGVYRLATPVTIDARHSGRDAAPLVIRGAPDGTTSIVGSVALTPQPLRLDPADLRRLPTIARDHIRLYRLPPAALESPRIRSVQRLDSLSGAVSLEVFDRAGALSPARWPDAGWESVSKGTADEADTGFTPPVDAARLARWSEEPDLWAEGFWTAKWLAESMPVSSVDPVRRRLLLDPRPSYGVDKGVRFRVFHALSELDRPGEWWRDAAHGLLVAWPRESDATLDVSVADRLFDIDGASHVRLENLRLGRTRGDAVLVHGGAADITIVHSGIAWTGGRAAAFDGATASGLERCTVSDTGGTAVLLRGGDRETLTPGGLFLRDSVVTRFSRLWPTQTGGVQIAGVGAQVTGSYIHGSSGEAIQVNGNEHRIAFNEIADVARDVGDIGAINSWVEWSQRGTMIEGNFLHDVRPTASNLEVKGIYLDAFSSGFTIRGNLFLRVQRPVFSNGGRDNRIVDNMFVASAPVEDGSAPAIHLSSVGLTISAKELANPQSQLRRWFAEAPVGSPVWRRRYPTLAGLLGDHPEVSRDNTATGNVFALGGTFEYWDKVDPALQSLAGNLGPGGIGLRSGADLAAVAATSVDPLDFAGLVDAAGKPLPRLPLDKMRRSTLPEDPFGR